jgi:hypothetical protein
MRLASIVLLSAAALSAAGSPPGGSCATAERHEFDFVIGNWLVRDASGQAIGTATIARAYAGCVLIETWLGAGSASESLGLIGYQPESDKWHRDFLDAAGVVLSVAGRMEGPAMVMTGKEYSPEGVRTHRVTWRPRSDGTFEEWWETSTDGERTWQVRLYGVFHRIAE